MAEDVTPSPGTLGGAAPAVNPPTVPASPGASDPSPTPTPAEAPWTAKGYKSWDDVDQTIERHKSAITGSQQEANRLRQEAQQAKQALELRESQFQTVLTALGGKTTETPPQPVTLEAAFDAYINGDKAGMQRIQQQLLQPAVTPEALQQQVVGVLQTALKPAQYADAVARNHPELNSPQDPLFQAVWSQYDAAAADPSTALMFQPDPAAVRTYTGPDGITRNIDLRVVNQLAWQVKAQRAREDGRKEELARQGQPTVLGPGTTTKAAEKEPDYWKEITDRDRRGIDQALANGLRVPGWPDVADPSKRKVAWAKHIYERRAKRNSAA